MIRDAYYWVQFKDEIAPEIAQWSGVGGWYRCGSDMIYSDEDVTRHIDGPIYPPKP